MKKTDLEIYGFSLYALGTLLLAIAVLTWASNVEQYAQQQEINDTILPLIVVSIVCLVTGIVFLFLWRVKQEGTPTPKVPLSEGQVSFRVWPIILLVVLAIVVYCVLSRLSII